MIYPVRVVPADETVGLALPKCDGEKQSPVQFIQYPHQKMKGDINLYDVASKKSLTPYFGKEEANKWCPSKFEQYSKQLKKTLKGPKEIDLKTEEKYLECALQKSMAEGEDQMKLAEVDEAVPEEISTTEVDEKRLDTNGSSDEEEETETRRRSSTQFTERKEPLRPGDRIEFYKQQSVAGDPTGYAVQPSQPANE